MFFSIASDNVPFDVHVTVYINEDLPTICPTPVWYFNILASRGTEFYTSFSTKYDVLPCQ